MSKAPSNPVDIDLGGGFVLKGDLTEMLAINLEDLPAQLATHPGWTGYVGALLVRAKRSQREAEAARDNLAVSLDAVVRARLTVGTKAPTETSIRKEVEATAEYQAMELECLQLASLSAEIENALLAYRDRTKALGEVSALLRSTQSV